MARGIPGYLRLRVVTTGPNGKEICNDLPHLHQVTWQERAYQPGNPGNSMLGAFTIPLHPPYTKGYKAAKFFYDQLDYYQRIEAYIGYNPRAIGLGKLKFAGIVDDISGPSWGPDGLMYELSGQSDLLLANLSRPFPGEFLSNDVTSAMLKSYLGTNELGWADTFNPFTAGNYTSTSIPAHSSAAWSAATDDNSAVVTASTGSGAELLSKIGASSSDRWFTQFAEVTGRLNPSSDTANAGEFGVGLSSSPANMNDSVVAYAVAVKSGSRYTITAQIINYVGGSGTVSQGTPTALVNVDDPQGKIPLTVGLLLTTSGNSNGTGTATLIINGKALPQLAVSGVSTRVKYPSVHFGVGGSGSPQGFFDQLVQMTRFTQDGPSTKASFVPGNVPASPVSLAYGNDPGPSFLEAIARLATRNGSYLRYSPQPYQVGVRTLGTMDVSPSPGNDLTAQVILSRRKGNLVGLARSANADYLASDTAVTGQSTLDGGGIGFVRDISTMLKYGVLQDEVLSFTHSDYNSLRRGGYSILQNKINVGAFGSKTATVMRTEDVAEKVAMLDRVKVNDPETNINNLSTLILGRDFTEGAPSEVLYLDQFSAELL